MNATLPEWVTVGAEVYGSHNGPILTIKSVGKAYISLSDGSKWRTRDLHKVGTPPPSKQWGPGYPRLTSRADVDHWRVVDLGRTLHAAVYQWTQNSRNELDLMALRNAIKRLAPHLGLTVTDQTDTKD